MIDLYSFPTPNGHKIHIALEELGLEYQAHPVDITKGEQFAPDFLLISPNNKIPAIVDSDGPGGGPFALSESGAILLYLAERTGKLMPESARDRHHVVQWVMTQVGHVGPMLGQYGHFVNTAPEKLPYAIERYQTEADRLFGVLELRLGQQKYLGGDTFSIADIATFPWVREPETYGQEPANLPNLIRWRDELGAREGVKRGLSVFADITAKYRQKMAEKKQAAEQKMAEDKGATEKA